MTIERIILAVAGTFIMLSLALGWSASPIFHHEYWLFFTLFVGANMFQAAFQLLPFCKYKAPSSKLISARQ